CIRRRTPYPRNLHLSHTAPHVICTLSLHDALPIYRREELDLRGPMRERLFVRVPADVVPTPTVHDAVLERADLFRALNRIPTHYRRLLVLWYATDWSVERILHYYRQQFPKLGRATIFRSRQEAVQVLTRQMNRNR